MTDNIARCPHCGTDFTPSHLLAEIERLQTELRLWQTEAEREVALWHNEVDRLARGWATPTLEPKP